MLTPEDNKLSIRYGFGVFLLRNHFCIQMHMIILTERTLKVIFKYLLSRVMGVDHKKL